MSVRAALSCFFLPLSFLMLSPAISLAHEVPDEVRIQMFLKPESHRLRIFVRIPAAAMIDILFPLRDSTPFLDLEQRGDYAAAGAHVWVADLLTIYEGDRPTAKPQILATRLSRKSDTAYANYETAEAAAMGTKLSVNISLLQDRAAVDVLLETPIASEKSDFRLQPRFGRLGVRVFTTVTFVPPEGGLRTFEYEGDPEQFSLNPSMGNSIRHFVAAGLKSIFTWVDFVLFALCLAVVFRGTPKPEMFGGVFLIAQGVSLTIAALAGGPPTALAVGITSVLSAAAVVYMGIESIVSGTGPAGLLVTAAGTGVVFGLSCWFRLQPLLQFGGAHRMTSVFAFNAGLVTGQIILLAMVISTVWLLLKYLSQPKVGAIILTALTIRISWHNLMERSHELSAAPLSNAMLSPAAITFAVICGGAGGILILWRRRRKVQSIA